MNLGDGRDGEEGQEINGEGGRDGGTEMEI